MLPRGLRTPFLMMACLAVGAPPTNRLDAADRADHPLRLRLNDEHARGVDFWVYNDLSAAFAEARRVNKPLFVTFRCVPCQACAGFDAEVAKGNEGIRKLAREKFVPVRQVEMKGVDLTQFQFDHDLNWAAMFVNADGTVYGRYGTQSAEGPDAYNSIASLEKAMHRVLALHADYPNNAASLTGKRAAKKPYKTPLEMPGMRNREKFAGPTARNNCIHCHNIHDAEQTYAREQGTFTQDMLWRYPLPDNVGLHVDPTDGRVVQSVKSDSPAATAGIRVGDVVTLVGGQAIIAIADIQWVLHHLPNRAASVRFRVTRDGSPSTHTLNLAPGWKRTDISWRGSIWSLEPKPGFWAPLHALTSDQRKTHNLPADADAFEVRWINMGLAAGRSAKGAGLREGDLIIRYDGKPVNLSPQEFNIDLRLNYRVGGKLGLTILREGEKKRVIVPLVE